MSADTLSRRILSTMSKNSFHLRTFQLMISNFQSTVTVFSVKLVKLPNPTFVSIWILLIPQLYLFTCLKTLHVLNSVSFWKDQRQNGATATSIIYEPSHDIECVLIKIRLWLKRECWPLLQASIIQKLMCQSCSCLSCHCYRDCHSK